MVLVSIPAIDLVELTQLDNNVMEVAICFLSLVDQATVSSSSSPSGRATVSEMQLLCKEVHQLSVQLSALSTELRTSFR